MGIEDYSIKLVNWSSEDEPFIQEVYRLLKDQENKIFDLVCGNKDYVLDYTEQSIKNGMVFIALDKDNSPCGFFMLDDVVGYKNNIHSCNLHCAIGKRSWGKNSRLICKRFLDYLADNFPPIKRLVASVPQHNFVVVKLLKDMGFKHEGTLKSNLVFPDKFGNEKYYDELIYTIVREDI